MKVELHINGRYEVELHPETEIERAVLKEMAARHEKGQPVSLLAAGGESNSPYRVVVKGS